MPRLKRINTENLFKCFQMSVSLMMNDKYIILKQLEKNGQCFSDSWE